MLNTDILNKSIYCPLTLDWLWRCLYFLIYNNFYFKWSYRWFLSYGFFLLAWPGSLWHRLGQPVVRGIILAVVFISFHLESLTWWNCLLRFFFVLKWKMSMVWRLRVLTFSALLCMVILTVRANFLPGYERKYLISFIIASVLLLQLPVTLSCKLK